MATKKYNPGFLSDDELVESFCVRTSEFESIVETLSENTGNSNQHLIVIGPRGSGKTSLLLRAAIEARRDPELSSRIFPVTFAEESYEVSTCGEFWLECLSRLADQAPLPEWTSGLASTCQDLRTIHDDRVLADRCLGSLLDFSDRVGKRLLLAVENLNMMFGDMLDRDAGWRLRKTLQTEPRIILLGSATSRFEEIDRPDRALYDLFRVINLHPLNEQECGALWKAVSGECPQIGKVRSLKILTGGSPRLLKVVAPLSAGRPLHMLLEDLLELIDDHTEYFKSHLDALAAQERRVYLALADLWKPATTREIAERARLKSGICSAQLNRLITRGVVSDKGGTPRRKQYYLTERLYNIYYLLRRRGVDRLVESLIHFMTAIYSKADLVDRVLSEATGCDESTRPIYRDTLNVLSELPEMTGYRDALLHSASSLEEAQSADAKLWREIVALMEEVNQHTRRECYDEAVKTCDEIIARANSRDTADYQRALVESLVNKGIVLGSLHRSEEAVASYDEAVARFDEGNSPDLCVPVAKALVNKGARLGHLGRVEEELEAYGEVVRRFEGSSVPGTLAVLAVALVNKGMTLVQSGRFEEAVDIWDDVVRRFATSDNSDVVVQVARALVSKGEALTRCGRLEEAVTTYDEAAKRSDQSRGVSAAIVARSLVRKGIALVQLHRLSEAQMIFQGIIDRFDADDSPEIAWAVAAALLNKGVMLGQSGQWEDALVVYDEVVARFAGSEIPGVVEQVARAMVNEGITFVENGRPLEGQAVCEKLIAQFGSSDNPSVTPQIATAFVTQGVALTQLDRDSEALDIYDEVDRRFGSNEAEEVVAHVAGALLNKGLVLLRLNRYADALETYDHVVDRFSECDVPGVIVQISTALSNKAWMLNQLTEMTTPGRGDLLVRFCNGEACERDLSALLSSVEHGSPVSVEAARALTFFSSQLASDRALKMICASAAADLLLPLVTALEHELGRKPRVAREVEEVAHDIRKEFARLRTATGPSNTIATAHD